MTKETTIKEKYKRFMVELDHGMIKAQRIIENKMKDPENESQEYITDLTLKTCKDLGLSYMAFNLINSWAIGKYC